MNETDAIVYNIDAKDNIIFVNDTWCEAAIAYDAPELSRESILNTYLWDHISDSTTQHLYKQIIERVRSGHSIHFKIRCDALKVKRLLAMKIELKSEDEVKFSVTPALSIDREPQAEIHLPAIDENSKLMLCSWCNRIEFADGDWREIEDAIEDLSLFRTENLPQLSHGMCKECYGRISRRLSPSSEE